MVKPGVERKLTDALLAGTFESPLWGSFLDLLRQATGADYASIDFCPPGRSFDELVHLLSGDSPQKTKEVYKEYFEPKRDKPLLDPTLIEGRAYSLAELEASGPRHVEFHRAFLAPMGLNAIRQMRVCEESGVHLWLSIIRRGKEFTAEEIAVLESIAPVLRGVLRHHVALERERFVASMTSEAVRRLQFGWLTLDKEGHVLDCDEQAQLALTRSGVLSKNSAGRLCAKPTRLDRELYRALDKVIEADHRPRALTLCRDPWLDMLIVPARNRFMSAKEPPAVIVYVHGDSWRTSDRCEQLAELFTLSPSESRLALALCRGMTITEAATEFGLTVETARSYSKTIYSKTGARGLPDLVRIVMRSVLAIAPEG